MSNIASACIRNRLHVLYLDERGDLFHRIRQANTQWTPWGQIRGARLVSITCAGVGEELHVTAIDQAGVWFHTIRYADGRWQDITQLPDQPLLND